MSRSSVLSSRFEPRLKVAHGGRQLAQIVRLLNDGKAFAYGFLGALAVAGRDQNRNFGMVLAYETSKLEPADAAGHQDVGKDQVVRAVRLQLVQSLRAVRGVV